MYTVDTTTQEAIEYVKQHQKELVNHFVKKRQFIRSSEPISIFMAGSPGAGKTEFSRSFIKQLENEGHLPILRIDADEIRELLPHYNGSNSDVVQPAAALGVEKLFDYVQKKEINALIDSTLADYHISLKNISRALHRN